MARKIAWETRATVCGGLIAGRSGLELAPTLGVSVSIVKLWARLAGVELMKGRVGGARPVPMDAVVSGSAGARDAGIGGSRWLTGRSFR